MEFRRGHLLYFVAVAEEGQMTRAAQRLHIAQPALSHAIAQLESDVGVTLLERHSRGVTLTQAGEAFLAKARTAVAAWDDAVQTASSLARVSRGTVEFGFVGTAPGLDSPAALEEFSRAHPHIDLRYRELPFPPASTASWLEQVDVAVCHSPPPDDAVWTQLLRREPRTLLMHRRHALAECERLTVADALEETFIGMHPSVDAAWAGFWSLDDHRGAPPAARTPDRVSNSHEVLAALSTRDAVTAVPASVARVIAGVPSAVRAVPLSDGDPCSIVLVGREDRCTAHVEAVRAFAARGSS